MQVHVICKTNKKTVFFYKGIADNVKLDGQSTKAEQAFVGLGHELSNTKLKDDPSL